MKTLFITLFAAGVVAAAQEDVLFVNFGNTAVTGWNQVTQTSGADLSTTVGGHKLEIDCTGGNIKDGNHVPVTKPWATGNFNGYTSSLADMGAALGVTVGADVWNTGIANGGSAGVSLTVGGYTAGSVYDVYLIGGSKKDDNSAANCYSWTLDASNVLTGVTTVQYDQTGRTGDNLTYITPATVTTSINAAQDVATLIKMSNVVANSDGNIIINLNGGQRASVNALAIKAVPEPATATLSLLALAGLAARRRRK